MGEGEPTERAFGSHGSTVGYNGHLTFEAPRRKTPSEECRRCQNSPGPLHVAKDPVVLKGVRFSSFFWRLADVGATLILRFIPRGEHMKTLIVVAAVLSTAALVFAVNAPVQDVTVVKAADVKWEEAKNMPSGVKSCLIHGDPAKGAFVLLMKAPPGTVWKPHMHSADEVVLIQSGEFLISASVKMDESKASTVDAGGYFALKAKTPHWAKAKTEVVFLRYGNGPADITYLDEKK
jgi:quercetin dioxygenase-like cupin family protein